MTVILPMRYEPPAVPTGGYPCEALPGYYLLEVLQRSAHLETWKARDPGGRLVCVQYVFVPTSSTLSAARVLGQTRRLLDMRHPHLASLLSVAYDAGRVVLVTELADQSLQDRFEECWQCSSTYGIPRQELLGYLEEAAQALDYLRAEHNLQHLALSPRNLMLRDDRLTVGDFGLVQLLWLPGGEELARINPRYAAPEAFEGRVSANTDQYSLALIYQEMLTGQLPQKAHSTRELADQRLSGFTDVSSLPANDREIVRRALHREPRERFASCVEFVTALQHASVTRAGLVYLPEEIPALGSNGTVAVPLACPAPPLQVIVDRLVATAAHVAGVGQFGRIRWVWTVDGYWEHRCAAFLPDGVGQNKLRSFAQRWNASHCELHDSFLRFELNLGAGWLRKWLPRKQDILEVCVEVGPPRPPPARLSDVLIRMRFLEGDSDAQRRLIEQVGPVIAEELHAHLMAPPDRRDDLRFPFDKPLLIAPVSGDRLHGDFQLQCVGKDISTKGIGIFARMEPPSRQLLIYQASTRDQALFALPAVVSRVDRTSDGWYEIGARFLVDDPASENSDR